MDERAQPADTMQQQAAQTPAVPDFRRLFESAPGSYLVLAPDLTIVNFTL